MFSSRLHWNLFGNPADRTSVQLAYLLDPNDPLRMLAFLDRNHWTSIYLWLSAILSSFSESSFFPNYHRSVENDDEFNFWWSKKILYILLQSSKQLHGKLNLFHRTSQRRNGLKKLLQYNEDGLSSLLTPLAVPASCCNSQNQSSFLDWENSATNPDDIYENEDILSPCVCIDNSRKSEATRVLQSFVLNI